ncbi:hypothetical protein SESBI_11047 [Sesbania bispinosa]|nr:hypothetical protein SESBI_11047 [Sesbania bispinosa]
MDTRFDIDGHVTTFGHPEWARTHEAASQISPMVSALVEGGTLCNLMSEDNNCLSGGPFPFPF